MKMSEDKEKEKNGQTDIEKLKQENEELNKEITMKSMLSNNAEYRLQQLRILEGIRIQLHSISQQIYDGNQLRKKQLNKLADDDDEDEEDEDEEYEREIARRRKKERV